MSTPDGLGFGSFFDRHVITGGTLNITPLAEVRLKPQNNHTTWWIPFTHNTQPCRHQLEATAAPHQSGPNESAAGSRALNDHIVYFRGRPASVSGTCTAGTTSAILHLSCPELRVPVPVR